MRGLIYQGRPVVQDPYNVAQCEKPLQLEGTTMAKKKIAPSVNLWRIISRAVEEGTLYGLTRAYKYSDNPSRETIANCCETAVRDALSEVLDFGD